MVTQYIGPEMRTETRAGSFTMKEKKAHEEIEKAEGEMGTRENPIKKSQDERKQLESCLLRAVLSPKNHGQNLSLSDNRIVLRSILKDFTPVKWSDHLCRIIVCPGDSPRQPNKMRCLWVCAVGFTLTTPQKNSAVHLVS